MMDSRGDEARWLDSEATARRLCVRVDRLSRLVRAGKIPKPDYHLGCRSPRWDKLAIDAVFQGGFSSSGANLALTDHQLASKANAENP